MKEEAFIILDECPIQATGVYYVNYDEALSKAISFIKKERSKTRSAADFKVAEYYMYRPLKSTRSRGADSIDVCFHVINFENDCGFALVSTDIRTTPIYAYSDKGHLDINDAMTNTGFYEFMKGAEQKYIDEIRSYRLDPIIPMPPDSDITSLAKIYYQGQYYYVKIEEFTIEKSPLVPTEWNQCSPYNLMCPIQYGGTYLFMNHAATGCVATALAQIIAYHQYPTSLGEVTFDWNTISNSCSFEYNTIDSASLMVADFVYRVAVSAQTQFGIQSSSNITKAILALIAWGYHTSNSSAFNESNIKNSIDNGYPIYCQGNDALQNGGHAWVIDGYRYTYELKTYYEATPPYSRCFTQQINQPTYYHCNWGWGTNKNAYCLNTFVSPNGQYDLNNKILYNIHP